MRPLNATEFAIPCDLSEAAFEEAHRVLAARLPGNEFSYECIRVASQGAATALMVAHRYQVCVELDFQYAPDEWSVHRQSYGDGKLASAAVWSPGA